MQTPTLSRRQTLGLMIAAGIAPGVVPARLLRAESPSQTLRLGIIGTGRMGRGDMKNAVHRGLSQRARMVAVCDLDQRRAEKAKQTVESIYRDRDKDFEPVKVYNDYRELLDRNEIDGVIISTPDHWLALPAIAAARAGKGVYLQKPLTYTIPEGRALVEAVNQNNVVLQTGSQQRSSLYFRRACEAVRNQRIGKLEKIEVTLPEDGGQGSSQSMEIPDSLNYDMWLGPTPKAPYTEDRVHPRDGFGRPGWLQIEQYCRGMITGWGAHMYDIAQWAMGEDQDSGPVQVQASAVFPDRGLFDVHTSFEARAEYANGVELVSGSGNPPSVRFTGSDGWISVQRGSFDAHDEDVLREPAGDDRITLYRSDNHMANFLQCLREGTQPAAPAEVGHRANSVCVTHHIAMKLNRALRWDPAQERFENDSEANELLDYQHRAPWTL